MSDPLPFLMLSRDEDGQPAVVIDGSYETVKGSAELLAAVPALATPEGIGRYCDAINHFSKGGDYHVIHDPAAYVAKYQARRQAEDPDAPFVEGAARLRDFGVSDTSEITPPKLAGATVVFYAEQDFLGLPYRVTGPAPTQPGGGLRYEPLPTRPENADA